MSRGFIYKSIKTHLMKDLIRMTSRFKMIQINGISLNSLINLKLDCDLALSRPGKFNNVEYEL